MLLLIGLSAVPAFAEEGQEGNSRRHFRDRGNITVGLGNWGGFNGGRLTGTYDLLWTKGKGRTSLGFFADAGANTPGSLILTQSELMREPQRAVGFQGGGILLEKRIGSLYASAGLGRYFITHFYPVEDSQPDPIISGIYAWGVRYALGVNYRRFLFQASATRMPSPPTEQRARNTIYSFEIGTRY
ncbi:hypothetical protein [Armatimonas sp.]|uniref:hypothetical protein n=1 Tax=Armatimonas sp. TaxID=1872638 RepID=UPI00286D69A0|nr:hypothetical protein [Armatimonas sp.]